ncbi:UNVERIFIED_CONTAM: hypothetical protein NCL1_26067 [Trichonephila clavipes]
MRESIMFVKDDESIGAEKGIQCIRIVTPDGLSNRKNNKQMFLNMVYALPSLQWLLRTVSAYSEPDGATFLAWMNDGETSSRRHGVGRPHAIKEKGHRTLSCMAERNRSQTVAQLKAQYNAGQSRIVSEHTVQRTLLDTGQRSKHPTRK